MLTAFLEKNVANDDELANAWKYQMSLLLASDEGMFPKCVLILSRLDVPYCQGAEPPWFAGAMTRALAPVKEDLAQLNGRVAALDNRVAGLENQVAALDVRLAAVETSNVHIRRMAAIVV